MNISKRLQKPLALLLAFALAFGSVSWNAFAEAAEAAPGGAIAEETLSTEIPEAETLEAVDEGEDGATVTEGEPAVVSAEGEPAPAAEEKSDEAVGGGETDGMMTDEAPDLESDADVTGNDLAVADPIAEQAEDPAPLRMRGAPKEVPVTISSFVIQNLSGQTVNHMYVSDRFHIAMDWDASENGANLHEGDYFDIALPGQMMFPSDSSAVDFNLYGDDGITVIATAHVTPGPDNKGGSVRIAFTGWVEGKENVKGSIRLAAQFDRSQVTIGEPNTFQIQVGSQVLPVTVTVTGPTDLPPEVLSKWGQGVEAGQGALVADRAEWHVRINHKKANLTNVVMSDYLSEGEGNETYIVGSFKLRRVEMSSTGSVIQTYETDDSIDLSGRLAIAADGRSFTLDLGDIAGDQYRLSYQTTYVSGTKLRNNMDLAATEEGKTVSASHQSASSGGQGTGDLANKIKIVKVDAEDNVTPLSGAVFEVERPDGTTFTLIT